MTSKASELEDIAQDYLQKATKYYPGLQLDQGEMLDGSTRHHARKYRFSFNSDILQGTEYAYKRKYNLIHYTPTLQNVIEILNSGFLKLSNLLALNDPHELDFIINNLDMQFTHDQIEEYKRNFFSASFCNVINSQKPDDFAMWRLYGADGYGAAIVFENLNFGKQWQRFLLAKVQYGETAAVNRFRKFIDFHNDFQKNHQNPFDDFPKALSSLMALHKNKIWDYEKEVRLLTHHRFDPHTLKEEGRHLCNLKHTISKKGTKYSFVELPVYNSDRYKNFASQPTAEQILSMLPILKIKSIILGYRHNHATFKNMIEVVKFCSQNYDYNIDVHQSYLTEQMR